LRATDNARGFCLDEPRAPSELDPRVRLTSPIEFLLTMNGQYPFSIETRANDYRAERG